MQRNPASLKRGGSKPRIRDVLKAAKADTKLSTSHADMEGMLSGVGVVAALVLSILVGLFYTMEMSELIAADYRISLLEFPDFRKFALAKLQELDFPMTVDVGPDRFGNPDVLDITEILLHPVCVSSYHGGVGDCYRDSSEIMAVDAVFHLTKDVFPMGLVTPWLDRNIPRASQSTTILLGWSAGCTVIFTLVLMGSIFFYTSLALSECREGEDKGNNLPTQYYNIIAMPMMLMAYLSMIIGLFFFFYNLCLLQTVRAPSLSVTIYLPLHWMYNILGPGTVLLAVLSVAALIVSNNYKYFEDGGPLQRNRIAPVSGDDEGMGGDGESGSDGEDKGEGMGGEGEVR